MENFTGKVQQIGLLEGKNNWDTWKYKVICLLKTVPKALDVVQGSFQRPTKPNAGSGDTVMSTYNQSLNSFISADSTALLILTTNMQEDTLRKVMRYTTAREVWLELHRLFDGSDEDKAYNLCMSFFGYKKDAADDVASHMSKLKNIWTQLNQELKSDNNEELPELLLICKILDTLDDTFFSFRSSWLLSPKSERTVEKLTSHLCAFERQLHSSNNTQQEALVTNSSKNTAFQEKKDKKLKCNYCQAIGHRVKNCQKWIKDGRPPKSSNPQTMPSTSKNANMVLISVESTEVFSIERDIKNWYVDNGATSHVTNRADLYQNFELFDEIRTVTTANGNSINAKGKGSVNIEAKVRGKSIGITLQDVWYVPAINKNLFSVLALHDRIPNSVFSSTTKECTVYVNGEAHLIGKRQQQGGLYRLDVRNVPPAKPIEVYATSATMQLYHERLVHQNKRHVKATVKRELGLDLPLDKDSCEGCLYGKAHRLKFGTRARATAPGELVHTDVCGPFEPSFQNFKYYVLFKDDFTGYRMVYFMKQKSEVKDNLAVMINETKVAGHTIKCLLSDNGGEFDNQAVQQILESHGIQQRLVAPYTPEQNGVSERENRTLVETARSLMYAHDPLPQRLWAELINTAAYVLNRTGPTNKEKSPYELWYRKRPIIKHLRVIGCTAYVHIPKQKRKKLDKKAIKGRLIGYDEDCYRIWITDGKKTILVRSRDVIFDEKPLPIATTEPSCVETDTNTREYELLLPMDDAIDKGKANQEIHEDPVKIQSEGSIHQDPPTIPSEEDPEQAVLPNDTERFLEGDPQDTVSNDPERVLEGDYLEQVQVEDNTVHESGVDDEVFHDAVPPPRYDLRDRSLLRRPKRFDDYVCVVESFPNDYKDAMSREDRENWLQAMDSEMKSLRGLNVWTPCDLPKGRKALPCKWVLRVKHNPDGSIDKYKARLVVKGFKQRKGLDYEQTFSPVARLATIRALLSVSAQEKLHLVQFDVTTAFLNGTLTEEIYMQQPEGYSDNSSKVYRLNRSLYGLKQAPRCWNSCFEGILLDFNFEQSEADFCLFTKKIGDKKILITLYVDDGLVAATDAELANSFLDDLRIRLTITTKPASYYLGLEIGQAADGSITIKQESYAKKILQRFGMTDCNPVSTPIEKEGVQAGKACEQENTFPYREAIGALAYLMVGTRPDLAYAVGLVSRKLENPTKDDWNKVKRIFRYLKGTTNVGITYSNAPKHLLGYSDADHGGDANTGRSTTGVVCLYAGAAVSWLSQRQATVAISTTEAEIVAASEAARELVWLQRIFRKLTGLDEIPTLKVDNEAAIRLAHNPEFHKRTKHIRVRHFFVREMVQSNTLNVIKTPSVDQLADVLTKPVSRPRLTDLRVRLGLKLLPMQ